MGQSDHVDQDRKSRSNIRWRTWYSVSKFGNGALITRDGRFTVLHLIPRVCESYVVDFNVVRDFCTRFFIDVSVQSMGQRVLGLIMYVIPGISPLYDFDRRHRLYVDWIFLWRWNQQPVWILSVSGILFHGTRYTIEGSDKRSGVTFWWCGIAIFILL